jgi:hypothetical protein
MVSRHANGTSVQQLQCCRLSSLCVKSGHIVVSYSAGKVQVPGLRHSGAEWRENRESKVFWFVAFWVALGKNL